VLGRRLAEAGPWWDAGVLRRLWDYQWPLQVSRVPGHVTQYFHNVVMSLILTTPAFAAYSLGARELPFIGSIGPSVASVLVPSLVLDAQEGRRAELCRKWRLACERTATATYLIAAFCVWHAAPVVQFLFSPAYTESSIPFRIFAALTFLRVIEYASLAKALGRTDLIMKSAFITAGVLVGLSVPLAWRFGALGMAASVFLGTSAGTAYYLIQYRRLLGVPLAEFFPWRRLLLLLGLAFGSTAVSAWAAAARLGLAADLSMFALGWKLASLFALAGGLYAPALALFGFMKLHLPGARQLSGV
jgi:O-antigen/teichoic acid export membrane protein